MRRGTLTFAFTALILSYYLLIGTTHMGIVPFVQLHPFSLGLMGFILTIWLFIRWRKKWQWHRTAFDPVMALWIAAFILSIVFNQATWRRSAEALWYMLLYIGLWYMLLDLLMNKVLSREIMVRAFLFTSFFVLLFALYQVYTAILDNTKIPRPESIFFISNAFAQYLVIVLPFVLSNTLNLRGIPRWVNGLMALATIPLLILSDSRGALLAAIAMVLVWIGLTMAERDLLSASRLKTWWQEQNAQVRITLIALLIIFIVIAVGIALSIINSLSEAGRSISLRTYLWDAGFNMFKEKPIFGHGLFTYGYHLARFSSIPPFRAQAHAHNVYFQIAAEMGFVGLLAMFSMGLLTLRAIWRNWRDSAARHRPMMTAAIAALVGVAIHHFFDVTAMMPAIAIAVLWVLLIAVVPNEPQAITSSWRKIAHPIGLIGLWIILLAVGFWNSGVYGNYAELLMAVDDEYTLEDYRETADALQTVIDSDPNQPAYVHMQGYLYGLAAEEGDLEAAELAATSYKRYTELEPYHAQGWSNLAGLYWQLGDTVNARNAIEQAILYAPAWDFYYHQRDVYTETQELEDVEPVETSGSRSGAAWASYQFLRMVFPQEYLPQTGWGNTER